MVTDKKPKFQGMYLNTGFNDREKGGGKRMIDDSDYEPLTTLIAKFTRGESVRGYKPQFGFEVKSQDIKDFDKQGRRAIEQAEKSLLPVDADTIDMHNAVKHVESIQSHIKAVKDAKAKKAKALEAAKKAAEDKKDDKQGNTTPKP